MGTGVKSIIENCFMPVEIVLGVASACERLCCDGWSVERSRGMTIKTFLGLDLISAKEEVGVTTAAMGTGIRSSAKKHSTLFTTGVKTPLARR